MPTIVLSKAPQKISCGVLSRNAIWAFLQELLKESEKELPRKKKNSWENPIRTSGRLAKSQKNSLRIQTRNSWRIPRKNICKIPKINFQGIFTDFLENFTKKLVEDSQKKNSWKFSRMNCKKKRLEELLEDFHRDIRKDFQKKLIEHRHQ